MKEQKRIQKTLQYTKTIVEPSIQSSSIVHIEKNDPIVQVDQIPSNLPAGFFDNPSKISTIKKREIPSFLPNDFFDEDPEIKPEDLQPRRESESDFFKNAPKPLKDGVIVQTIASKRAELYSEKPIEPVEPTTESERLAREMFKRRPGEKIETIKETYTNFFFFSYLSL